MKFKFIVVFFILIILILDSCSESKSDGKGEATKSVKVSVVVPIVRKVEHIITAVGTLEPEDEVEISAEVAGIIDEIRFEEGQKVKPGEILAVLDKTNFKLNLKNSKALLERAKANLFLAQSTFERRKKLYDKKFITEQEFQELSVSLDEAKAQFESAVSNCELAEKSLADTIIKAPLNKNMRSGDSWEVQKKILSKGEYVNVGKPIVVLVNRTTLQLVFTVTEKDSHFISPCKKVIFNVPPLPNKKFEATVFYISPKAREDTRTVVIKGRIDNKDLILRPGYSANINLCAEIKEKAITIPIKAIRFDRDTPYVFIVNNEGILCKRAVVCGVEKEDFVEIISGIEQNDKIAIRRGPFVKEGQKVEVVQE